MAMLVTFLCQPGDSTKSVQFGGVTFTKGSPEEIPGDHPLRDLFVHNRFFRVEEAVAAEPVVVPVTDPVVDPVPAVPVQPASVPIVEDIDAIRAELTRRLIPFHPLLGLVKLRALLDAARASD